MSKLYLVTGATGHLGYTVAQNLAQRGERVRGLVLPSDPYVQHLPAGVEPCPGDVLNRCSLERFFGEESEEERIVIHCAGVVGVGTRFNPKMQAVNVDGTRNVVDLCREREVRKLVYVSSVHAIPEPAGGGLIREIDSFRPEMVVGQYAKTKAEATAGVLEAARQGLDASVVHPSGLLGPNDWQGGHMTQLIVEYCKRHLPAIVRGGYDFSDVRDVAQGIVACAEQGRRGECYLLSGCFTTVESLMAQLRRITNGPAIRTVLPMWFAKATALLAERYYALRRVKPLFTPLSLYTLTSDSNFSCEKAEKELHYTVRPLEETLRDTYEWLKQAGRVA